MAAIRRLVTPVLQKTGRSQIGTRSGAAASQPALLLTTEFRPGLIRPRPARLVRRFYNRLEMFGSHWVYVAILLIVVLIIFGPGRLPELGGAVGKAMREFRKATSELTNEMTTAVQVKPEPPSPAPSAAISESIAKSPTSEATPSTS